MAVVDVLIVGGGPVGLTARALLDRWGLRTLLVEKRAELSPFPRSRLINVRSMEIFRQLGVAAEVASRAFAPEYGRVRFRDTMQDRDFASAAMVGINAPIAESPAIGAVSSQVRLEPTLLAAADGETRFGVELTDLVEDSDGVEVTLVDRRSGAETRLRTRFVLAADGANSTVRRLRGIGTTGPGSIGSSTTVTFDADLDAWSADQPAGVYFTADGGFMPLYPEGGWAYVRPTPEDRDDVDWPSLVARALGPGPDVKIDVSGIQHWTVNAFVAERFRESRILLAGDAAHAIPPTGGLGMNAGIADVHNLSWKLAGVLRGWAGPSLLSSYESERRPVAAETLRQAVANSQLWVQAQSARREQLQSGAAASATVQLPWSERYFAQLGFVLGTAYGSAHGSASATGTDYVPTARPGHRMPHIWLDEHRSTLDTIGEWFTLLTPAPADWVQQEPAPWPLHVEALAPEHATGWELSARGAILVRPDGYIEARWNDLPAGGSAVRDALRG